MLQLLRRRRRRIGVLLRRRRHRLHRRRRRTRRWSSSSSRSSPDGHGRAAAIFLNEGAGTARTDRVRETVELARHALDADLHVTATRDVVELTEWLGGLFGHYATAVIVGGDGSLATAYNVAAGRPDLRLGYIPAGFGNASRHLLRLPEDAEGLVEVLSRGDARPVDLVEVDGRLALFAGAGWDALVAGRYAEAGAKRLPGWASAIARSVPDLWRRPSVEVRADGWVVHRGPIELLIVGTTPFYGRGLRVNPGARPDAGRLSMRVYPGPAPRLALEAGTLGARRAAAGAADRRDRGPVHASTGRSIPMQADGDLIGSARRLAIRAAAGGGPAHRPLGLSRRTASSAANAARRSRCGPEPWIRSSVCGIETAPVTATRTRLRPCASCGSSDSWIDGVADRRPGSPARVEHAADEARRTLARRRGREDREQRALGVRLPAGQRRRAERTQSSEGGRGQVLVVDAVGVLAERLTRRADQRVQSAGVAAGREADVHAVVSGVDPGFDAGRWCVEQRPQPLGHCGLADAERLHRAHRQRREAEALRPGGVGAAPSTSAASPTARPA